MIVGCRYTDARPLSCPRVRVSARVDLTVDDQFFEWLCILGPILHSFFRISATDSPGTAKLPV